MFGSVLIANRGEIACRIITTLRRLGIRAIAVHSDADREALHVALADEAIRIGPPPAGESYLRIEAILDAARRTGAEAIHPGYGFLAENAAFAAACAAAGVAFIGPPPETIALMGAKDRAKAAMAAAGVPVVPGWDGDAGDDREVAEAAGALGLPVLIKAAAGGGGRGMRVIHEKAAFTAALEAARREAEGAFGDRRVLLERWLERPRHIEVQVFGDAHGNVVHLFERDCSIQRRHQKIVEEAPAPGLSETQRDDLCATAVRAAAAIGYVGAGTVEFLMDRAGAFHFIEMNTRLQVEHPVTEAIVFEDLVEWQVRVAAGEPLPRRQEDIVPLGHAIEVRLCAEDPARGFVPSAGRLARFRVPTGLHVTLHTGVREGDTVGLHYDSLLAKIVVQGRERAAVCRRLAAALGELEVAGPATNQELLRRIAGHPDFRRGGVDTGWLEAQAGTLLAAVGPDDEALARAALWLLDEQRQRAATAAARNDEPGSPWHAPDGWRLNHPGAITLRLRAAGRMVAIEAHPEGAGWRLGLGERVLRGRSWRDRGGRLLAELEGHTRPLRGVRVGADLQLFLDGGPVRVGLVDPLAEAEPADEAGGLLTAPMPGRVVRRHVAPGDRVAAGAPLLVLEAMKMEHTVAAPAAGRIAALHYGEGDQVAEGAVLLDLEVADD